MGDFTGTIPTFAAFQKARASDQTTEANALTALTAAWTDYSGTVTLTNLTKGNGTVLASYRRLNKTLDVKFKFTLGTTSAVGTGPEVSLPSGLTFATFYNDDVDPLGVVVLNDAGTATRGGFIRPDHTNSRIIISSYTTAGVLQAVNSTTPHTWGTGDAISFLAMGIELA